MLYAQSHEVGIVLYGTKKSSNYLNDNNSDQYRHVTTLRQLEKLDLESFRRLDEIVCEEEPIKIKEEGDLMDGLIVGLDMIARHCGTKKYKKRVFVITDGERETKYDKDELKQVISNINEHDARVNVITLDFCDDLAEDDDDDEDEDEEEQDKKMKAPNPRETKA